MRVVVESPLNADTTAGVQRNLRYLMWACRELALKGYDPIASHLGAPWYLNDKVPEERELGMHSEWFWQPGVPHLFYTDLGMSGGMKTAWERCYELEIPRQRCALQNWEAFESGAFPPHTSGFDIRDASEYDLLSNVMVEIEEPKPLGKPCDYFLIGAIVKWRSPEGGLNVGIVAGHIVDRGPRGFLEITDRYRKQVWKVPADRVDIGTLDELDHGYERRRGVPRNAPVVTASSIAPDPEWRPLPGAADPHEEATP